MRELESAFVKHLSADGQLVMPAVARHVTFEPAGVVLGRPVGSYGDPTWRAFVPWHRVVAIEWTEDA